MRKIIRTATSLRATLRGGEAIQAMYGLLRHFVARNDGESMIYHWNGLWFKIITKKLIATLFIFFVLFALTLSTPAWSLSAQTNRSIIEEGESLELVLTVDPRSHATQPDLSPLQENFDVISTGRTQQMRIINGKQSSSLQWIIRLAPKHTGKLTIPALNLGSERSQPIPIEVLNASRQNTAQRAKTIFIESQVTPKNAYVQSQVHYTTKLFFANNVVEGSLTAPNIDNAVVKRLGDDIHYETQRKNQRYQVVERHYALFPQTSGNLTIKAPTFNGQVAIRSDVNTLWGGLVQETQPVRVHGKATTLNIKTQPTNFTGQTWLPAKELVVKSRLSSQRSKWLAGEARTLTLLIKAKGLTAAQLPEITLEPIDNVNTYPDQAELVDTIEQFNVTGIRRQNIALVPTGKGRFTLPAIQVKWWNTAQNKMMTARLPAKTFTIIANPHQAQQTPTVSDTTVPTNSQTPTQLNSNLDKKWLVMIMLCLSGWLATILVWQRTRLKQLFFSNKSRQPKIKQPKQTELTKAIFKACEQHDPFAAKAALLTWAQHQRPKKYFKTLADLSVLTTNPTCLQALQSLDKACYSQNTWDGHACWEAIASLWQASSKKTKQKNKAVSLKPLYPNS